ncbi:MAG: 3-phosphoshikimate 1-carboxyvinyltransferase [Candidatus Westeberhardia cardiocondylae]|nr:3-phosphoshikimate 1-carboxyvinyltransferase [Candidatus Westeberhardia cardiocondylae]
MNTKNLTIKPISLVDGVINLPGSKSISNRALLLAAQSYGVTHLNNLLKSDDIKYMLSAFRHLNINYEISKNFSHCKIFGVGKPLQYKNPLTLFLGNAGTAIRPLTAALCINSKNVILTGIPRMKERPIKHLVDALKQGGANISYLEKDGYPPIELHGGYKGGLININGSISSQFLSSLLMMAPLAPKDTHILVSGELVSKPYVSLTLELMKIFGINIKNNNYKSFYIHGNSTYRSPGEFTIEGDASSGSYFLAAAAIRGGTVRVTGINKRSIQGDIDFVNILNKMGAKINWGDNYVECTKNTLQSIDMDMNHIPDSAMTAAIVALFTKNNKNSTIIRNIYNWRVKETDRLSAMSNELKKIGAYIIENKDSLIITPPKKFISSIIETYNDHRMAMCFSLIALSGVPITIMNPKCINKTFPDFFNNFFKISKFS